MDLRTIVAQYITHAANEVDAKGNRRAGPTMSAYRRALEGFVAACEQHCDGDLTKLPEKFIENEWMGTQQSVVDKPIQLRVRVGALKQFTAWCYRNNIPCAPLAFPSIKTPPAKPKPKKEVPVSDVTMLGDYMQADPVPTTAPNVVPLAPQMPVEPTPAPRVQAAPAAPKQPPKPVGSGRPANPLASMLPSGQYKLRVRREREMDDPVWVADFPAERVAAHGALEPFLGREVAPRLAVQGLVGDVTFLVCAVGPNGAEGERARITVAIPAAQPVAPSPAVAGVAAPVMTAAPGLGGDLTDVLAYHRKVQEELEERLAKRIEAQKQPAPTPVQENRVQNNELDSLKQMMASLAGSVQSLASRVEDMASRPSRASMDDFMGAPPMPPPAPQLDILAVLKAVNEMGASRQPVAPPPPQMGLPEMIGMFSQMRQAFAPQNVQIDVSPLEERIDAMQAKLDAAAKKKGEISEMVENVKAMKDLMGLMGMGNEKKEAGGIGGALAGLVDKIVNDPEPIAMAVERVLGATAQLKAANTGRPVGQAAPPQPRDPLPAELREATDALIGANGDAAIVAAGYEWITLLGQIPQTKKLADRLTSLLREGKTNELTIYLKQILTHFGYAQKVPLARIQTIATALIAQVQRANQSEDDGEEAEESEESDETPDMTVTVGGMAGEYVEQGDTDEEEEQEEEQEEQDEDEQFTEGDEPQDEAVMTDEEGVEHVEAPVAAAPAPKKRGRPPKNKAKKEAPKRKRRSKEEMAAWRAAKDEAKRLREEAKAAREAARAARERASAAANGDFVLADAPEPVAV